MAIGYLFVAITAVALSSIVLAKIHDDYGHNKVGNLCVFVFWVAICNLYLYITVDILLDQWFAYISFFIFLLLSLVAGITSNKNE